MELAGVLSLITIQLWLGRLLGLSTHTHTLWVRRVSTPQVGVFALLMPGKEHQYCGPSALRLAFFMGYEF